MDTAFAADAKFVRLARKSLSEVAFAASVGVFWMILADARRSRCATINWDDYTEYAEQIAALQDAKLLTSDGFEEATFDNWAPAYKAPWDKDRTVGTGDDAEVRKGTQGYAKGTQGTQSTLTSTLLTSTHLSSPSVSSTESEVVPSARASELPAEDDSATYACRKLPDGGRWLADREYTAAWDDLDRRFSAEWVHASIADAYVELIGKGRVRAWDLKKAAEMGCAERSRLEERQRADKEQRREDQEADELRERTASMTDEERERQKLTRKAVGVWIRGGRKGSVPLDVAGLRSWLTQNGAPA